MKGRAAVLAIALAACNRAPAQDSPVAASASNRISTQPSPLAEAARPRALEAARQLERASERLSLATRERRLTDARAASLELRRAWRAIEPTARVLAPVAASQIDPEGEEPDEAPKRAGLRVIADALEAAVPDLELLDASVRRTDAAVRLASRELGTATWDAPRLGVALSRAVFDWGCRLDGSRAESPQELAIDVLDGGRAVLGWVRVLSSVTRARDPDLADRLEQQALGIESWIGRQGVEPKDKLAVLILSGELGAEVRSAAHALTGKTVRPPFLAHRKRRASEWQEPVQIATFPALLGAPPRPDRVELGAALFFDPRLSSNVTMACAGCHRAELALGSGKHRPLTAAGHPVARDVPAIWNVAYEPMLFWDGRASTLSDQARISVESEMGARWDDVVERLRQDSELEARFQLAFSDGLSAANVRSALTEFQRTLIRDSTPLDRFVRGDRSAMTPEMQRGFDLYFGRARCSRCHKLPLTSGSMPPRFVSAGVSAIGVPRAPNARALDPDRGRGAATRAADDEHAFKVPTLRNLALTAPYFHNGAFATLEQVVDFYAKGSGAALGIRLTNFDPDARAFELSASERRALIVFLRDGLRDANVN
jgi:cytochrome c peroxidase